KTYAAQSSHLHARAVCGHGARNARGKHVGCRDREAEIVRSRDRPHRDNLGRPTLAIGQVLLANPFADRNDNAFPSDHGSQAKGESNRYLYPIRNEFGGVVEALLIGAKHRHLRLRKVVLLILLQESYGFRGEIHIVTGVADLGCRDLRDRAIGWIWFAMLRI